MAKLISSRQDDDLVFMMDRTIRLLLSGFGRKMRTSSSEIAIMSLRERTAWAEDTWS